MDSAMWAWGGVDKREAGEVTHKQVPRGPGNSLLPAVKVRFQQVFLSFQKLPPAAATWLWLTGGPLCPTPGARRMEGPWERVLGPLVQKLQDPGEEPSSDL